VFNARALRAARRITSAPPTAHSAAQSCVSRPQSASQGSSLRPRAPREPRQLSSQNPLPFRRIFTLRPRLSPWVSAAGRLERPVPLRSTRHLALRNPLPHGVDLREGRRPSARRGWVILQDQSLVVALHRGRRHRRRRRRHRHRHLQRVCRRRNAQDTAAAHCLRRRCRTVCRQCRRQAILLPQGCSG
jgi:hypothetical protein